MTTDSTNPIAVGTSYNDAMKKWDLMLQIGNFASESEVKAAAAHLKEWIEREFTGIFHRVQ